MTITHSPDYSLSRRDFVCRSSLGAGAVLLGREAIAEQAGSSRPASGELPRRVLGRTQVPITLFTLGTAPCGHMDPPEIAKLVNVALDEGVNAVDTSEKYKNSQEGVGLALGPRRKDVFLSTKVFANTIAEAEESLAKSIRLLKTDYFDLLYYHSLGNLDVSRALEPDGVFTWLLKQKKAGTCRFLGISGHCIPSRFPRFLETGQVDVLLAVLNFVDCHTYNFEQTVLPVAVKHNVGVVAMKVFGGAAKMNYKQPQGPQMPLEQIPVALRYALSLPGVTTANLGVHSAEQIRHNVQMVRDFKPLSPEEMAALAPLGQELAAKWGPHFGPVQEKTA